MLLRSQNQGYAILCRDDYGPTFGREYDLHISDNANSHTNNYVMGAGTYSFPRPRGTFFTGESEFFVTNYEVFALLH